MSEPTMNVRATMFALMLGGMAAAQATVGATDQGSTSSPASANTVSAPGQARVADKFAVPFITLAGSRENAVALSTALRNGSTATLTYTSIAADGTTMTTMVEITTPTKPMGWGNVSHSLALARFALNQEGISNPTGAQLRAALDGGTIMTADGRSLTFAGVLQQRADGMGFGRIAQSYGTTMGAVNRGIKASATSDEMTTTAVGSSSPTVTAPKVASAPSVAAGRGLTTAAGTAAGTAASAGQGANGLTTAAGATSRGNPHGIVTANGGAHGNGNAYGRGVVTASGSSAGIASSGAATSGASNGVVTGAGSAGHVVTADPGHGAGSGNGHGKGKSGS